MQNQNAFQDILINFLIFGPLSIYYYNLVLFIIADSLESANWSTLAFFNLS